jgi:hypothetical protein
MDWSVAFDGYLTSAATTLIAIGGIALTLRFDRRSSSRQRLNDLVDELYDYVAKVGEDPGSLTGPTLDYDLNVVNRPAADVIMKCTKVETWAEAAGEKWFARVIRLRIDEFDRAAGMEDAALVSLALNSLEKNLSYFSLGKPKSGNDHFKLKVKQARQSAKDDETAAQRKMLDAARRFRQERESKEKAERATKKAAKKAARRGRP